MEWVGPGYNSMVRCVRSSWRVTSVGYKVSLEVCSAIKEYKFTYFAHVGDFLAI